MNAASSSLPSTATSTTAQLEAPPALPPSNALGQPASAASTSSGMTIRGFLVGVATGATKLAVGHPFDTIKVRLQTEGKSGRFGGALDCVRKTIAREGIRGLYKGATPPLLGWALMDSVQLGTLTNLRILQQSDPNTPLTVGQHALAGLGAGATVSLVATPVEFLKAKLQVQYGDAATTRFRGPVDCVKQVIRSHKWGILGLWAQLPATLLFRSNFWLLWGSYEVFTQQLRHWHVGEAWIPFLAGGLAANAFWAVSFPADVIKNRMMTQPLVPPSPNPYRSIASTARHIYATEGARGFSEVRHLPTSILSNKWGSTHCFRVLESGARRLGLNQRVKSIATDH
ncbi:mitochondrial carrier domain-containing protein [Catenaria anguillulae PL171]|uniref:Mitochondrial carrier domain-containing protein n=1 Tax=Catenaria anguillulae PL171 TaxID=765915 RepID=A0A1Y2HVY3_9FUNG|nr:mitochondrial carrier domain-containing protein [Catenaria anguillulae PL171]